MQSVQRGVLTSVLAPAGDGLRKAVRGIVLLNQGSVEAFVKIIDHRELLVECLCAVLGRLLNLNVPEPMIVLVPSKLTGAADDQFAFGSVSVAHGSLRPWCANIGQPAVARRLRDWSGLIPAACFDEWIANPDRHVGNVLYDGKDEFWLIDHGLALASTLAVETAVANHLFGLLTAGLGESDRLLLKSKALGVMDSYIAQTLDSIAHALSGGFWSAAVIQQLVAWLISRKDQLLRLAAARIPTDQGILFTGAVNGGA